MSQSMRMTVHITATNDGRRRKKNDSRTIAAAVRSRDGRSTGDMDHPTNVECSGLLWPRGALLNACTNIGIISFSSKIRGTGQSGTASSRKGSERRRGHETCYNG